MIFLLLCLFLTACASTGNLDRYPKRRIDRPYTLPKGVATWEPSWDYKSVNYDGNIDREDSYSVLIWTQSLTDNLNITWFPLPLLLSYQIYRTEQIVYGMDIGITNLSYSTENKWIIGTVMSGYQRFKFNRWLALGSRLSLEDVIRTRKADDDSWDVELATGPIFQISDDIAVHPKIHYAVERNYPSINDRPETLKNNTYYLIPASIVVSWNLDRQWELIVGYQDKRMGYSEHLRETDAHVGLVHYW